MSVNRGFKGQNFYGYPPAGWNVDKRAAGERLGAYHVRRAARWMRRARRLDLDPATDAPAHIVRMLGTWEKAGRPD